MNVSDGLQALSRLMSLVTMSRLNPSTPPLAGQGGSTTRCIWDRRATYKRPSWIAILFPSELVRSLRVSYVSRSRAKRWPSFKADSWLKQDRDPLPQREFSMLGNTVLGAHERSATAMAQEPAPKGPRLM